MSEPKDSGAARPVTAGARPSLKQSLGLDRHPLTPGKIGLLVAAGVMMVLGAVLAFSGGKPVPESAAASPSAVAPTNGGKPGGLLGSGFAESRPVPGGQPSSPASGDTAVPHDGALGLHDLSPFMLKGGFGLFIGFSIGFAIRAFLRLGAVVAGFYFLVLTMMAYVGWVDIHWDVMSRQFSHLASTLGTQFESLKTFLTGAIPASGLTVAGFAAGLRKR